MADDIRDLSMRAVEGEITTLAGHLAAGTCRFLQLLAAFDTGGGWHGTGIRTCAQWLSWKCGLSTGTAREQLRVAHALDGLPVVTEAFAAGRLSYSKVRALTRVATAKGEASLVETATACTASQLDRLCSGLVRARSNAEVLDHAARASFRAVWEEDGMLRISGRLSPEDGAVLLAALAELRKPAVTDPAAAPDAQPASAEAPTEEAEAGGLAPAEAPGEVPDTGQTASAAALPARSEPRLPGDQYRDASERSARSDAAALVALARHALDQPPSAASAAPVRLIVHTTEAAMRRGEPHESVPAGARPPSGDTADPEPADVPAGSDTERDVGEAPSAETPTAGALDAGPGIPVLPLGPETLRRLTCQALVEPATHPDIGRGDAWETGEAVEAVAGEPEGGRRPRTEHRFASARQRRALFRRDDGCAWPGCPGRRALHAHHRVPWSQGGPTTLENLLLTCAHHHLLLHEGGWQLEPRHDPSGRRRWAAVHDDGRVMSPSPATSGDANDLQEAHNGDVATDSVTGTWSGEPLDLAYAVSVFA